MHAWYSASRECLLYEYATYGLKYESGIAVSWGALLGYDILIFLLTILKAYNEWRWYGNFEGDYLSKYVYRDGEPSDVGQDWLRTNVGVGSIYFA